MGNIGLDQMLMLAFALFAIGAIATSACTKDWRKAGYIAVVFALGATVALWTLAARVFVSGPASSRAYLILRPIGASLTFHVDKLSAVFLLVLPFVGLAAMLYAFRYMPKVYAQYSPSRYYPFALLLTAAMVGVVTVSDLFFFFIFWEVMSLTSWALVWFDRENETKVRAAWVYFVVIHVASACMLVAGIVVYSKSGSFAFSDIARTMSEIARTSPALIHALVGLFLIAFVTKAGMFPFGGWLPEAHPAAPAPASAVFSGAMIKTGIYGILRILLGFTLPPELATIWGGIIATLGALSIFVGTVTALRQDDVKRVLSFHSIGQIGYVLLAIGVGVFFLPRNPALATVALIAGLYHVINHACFKSLLFLNAGSAEYYTGTRNLNLIGGLGKLMPITMTTAIIASLSIAGIPPLNGFVSKWLIYHSTIRGGIESPLFLLLFIVAIFSSIATLASFMKVLGATFLGQLSTNGNEITGDVPASMTIPQIGFSAACVLLGVAPFLPLALLYQAVGDTVGRGYAPSFAGLFGTSATGVSLDMGAGQIGAWNPVYVVIAMAACTLVAYAISRAGHAPHRQTAPWYGGEEDPPEDVRYRAHGFVLPFKEVFAKIYPGIPMPRISALKSLRAVLDLDGWFYKGLLNVGSAVTGRLSHWHSGLPQTYMLWQAVGFVIVVCVLFTWLVR